MQRPSLRLPQPTPPPVPRSTTTWRGYGQALAFFALLFGVYAITAILEGAAQWGVARDWSAWADRWARLGLWATLAALTLWLAAAKTRHCQLWALLFTSAIAGEALVTSGRMNAPAWLYDVLATIAAVILATALARKHGLSISSFGLGRPRGDHAMRRQADMVFWWGFRACFASNVAGFAVEWMGLPHGSSTVHGHASVAVSVADRLAAGVCEELLMAVVVVVLAAARRPVWEIYALSMMMRVSYHLYYQAVAPSVLIIGIVNIWLYRRTGRLTPLILAHIAWDLIGWARTGGIAWGLAVAGAVLVIDQLVGTFWVGEPAPDAEQEPALTAARP
ncbi:CPBP family intramembrane glutamic endopeptidase [Actinoallomurus sp. NPDC052274]|uniref:CPBP family intramembrane glutamic endopeptidase n=1 Tax=Actinoallomurus sp. NPDC052274 TaxID=3155420 RepID=UPI00343C1504